MPPWRPKPNISNHSHTSSLKLSPTCQRLAQKTPSTKQFSSTPQHSTRQRRDMWRWIHGPGAAFRDPLPGSTNYLNAYDANGNLIRAIKSSRLKDDALEGTEKSSQEDGIDEEETRNIASGKPIPKEGQDDLIPFPLNRQFRSQHVLSEELREEIWSRVVLGKQSVKLVSAALSVEISRVGAVVRLKSIEKEWEKVVSVPNHFLMGSYCSTIYSMMSQYKQLRLVLKTHKMVTEIRTSELYFYSFFYMSHLDINVHLYDLIMVDNRGNRLQIPTLALSVPCFLLLLTTLTVYYLAMKLSMTSPCIETHFLRYSTRFLNPAISHALMLAASSTPLSFQPTPGFPTLNSSPKRKMMMQEWSAARLKSDTYRGTISSCSRPSNESG